MFGRVGPGAVRRKIRVNLFGAPEFSVDGVPVEFPQGRVLAVVAVLALAAGRSVAVETIAERVWGEASPADPRAAVHTAVARIRRLLGRAAVVKRGAGYELAVDPEDVDVLRFERLVDNAGDRDATEALSLLGEATALSRGDLFGPYASDWLALYEGPRLVDRYLSAVERRIDLELAANAIPVELPSDLRELCARHPLRESLWLRLLRVLDATGRRADALMSYEELRRRIANELGVAPAAELRQVHAGLLEGRLPTSIEAAEEVPRQLPPDLRGGLVGRDRDLRRLDENVRCSADGGGLVVVHGTGGVGKTTLVVHWAHRARDQFPHGQLFVDLRGFGPGEPLAASAALAELLLGLGVPTDRVPNGTDARTAMFRSRVADRRVLVVLDNARSAEQVRPLLAGSGVLTLVTSRSQLRGLAARERAERIALEVLEPADATSLLTERLAGERVEHDEDSVDRLAEICGRLPLALSIAAERAGRNPDRPLRDLIQQLENNRERLELLEAGDDLSTDLRAVMSWSYRALEPEAANLFRLLGMTPGGDFTVPSAAALAGIPRMDALRVLDQLTDAHLVDQTRLGRFTVHDLTRAYATEVAERDCSAADRQSAQERLCSWYTWSAVNAHTVTRNEPLPRRYGAPRDGTKPLDFHDARQALAWFEREDRTLHRTVDLANELGLYDDVIMLGRSLWNYWRYRSSFDDAPGVGASMLAAALAAGYKHAEASALHHLSAMYFYRREFDRTLHYAEESLREYRAVGDESDACLALGSVGLALLMLGRLDEAIATLEQAVESSKACGNGLALTTALNNLANAYKDNGRSGDAVRTATAALELSRDAKQQIEEAFILDSLALALVSHGDPAAAAARQEEALAIHRALDNKWHQAVTLRDLARLLLMVGEKSQARARCAEGLSILDELAAEDNERLSRADFEDLLARASG